MAKGILKVTDKNWVQQVTTWRQIKDVIFIGIGVIMASIGLKGFLLPNGFFDGGAMGVSLLL